MTYQEYCTMSTSPRKEELEQKWSDWQDWLIHRYRPCIGEIRPAPDGRRRTIDSPWPDKIYRSGHEDLFKKKKQSSAPIQTQIQDSPPPDGDPEPMNTIGQSSIQKSDTVESHTLQGSEGPPRKPPQLLGQM
jgi:hypothetical protein